MVNDSLLHIEDYDGLSIENTVITFSCPPGFMLVGPNSATCTRNGEWEPNFAGVMCRTTTGNQLFMSRSLSIYHYNVESACMCYKL